MIRPGTEDGNSRSDTSGRGGLETESATTGAVETPGSAVSPDHLKSTAEAPLAYTFDPEETPAQAIIDAVAAADGRDPLSLPPLFDAIDPDALNGLVAQPRSGSARRSWALSFEYGGWLVTVDANHQIVLEP
ncbi:HalOD1 output domain-containing protein [Natronosalvus caseinilyticus]|uniref:HalOD1 output domain-containing protein n=1 Tax=Natronosalvus caseinilyticus TaxID=2953747 RepID=UPI0028AC4E4A|nr:HalOD1 output domain-containing protein [Natronosalvus caseinilyticus]